MEKKKILGILIAVSMLAQLTACSEEKTSEKIADSAASTEAAATEADAEDDDHYSIAQELFEGEVLGMSMSLDEEGGLSIYRNTNGSHSMGEDGTWTVFVYLCGTDLESSQASASLDIEEMLEGSSGNDVRFVVETGGTNEWQAFGISNEEIQRYVIEDGEMSLVDSQPDALMSDESTFEEFLTWGVENYPADKMGVIMWNHGGGSIAGVCFDERADGDSLKLSDINNAFSAVSAHMSDKFEFVGFDACLMGSVECANILATYARYMYGSEETESGYGWDYTAIGECLCGNPFADGAELGKIICDSFYESSKRSEDESNSTLSCIDLSKIDDVIIALNDFSRNLYDATEDVSVLADFVRAANNAENFGGNNKTEGYTNMVDLAALVSCGSECAEGADQVLQAIDEAVVYNKNGILHENACGLSAYYPLSIMGNIELKTYGDIALNPYYLSFVDRIAYNFSDISDGAYDNENIINYWSEIWAGDGIDLSELDFEDLWAEYGDLIATGESRFIEFFDEPQLFDDGVFGFSLTDESLQYAESVQANVFAPSDDGEDLISYGISVYINSDWETGVFTDAFDGSWYSLPDGQNLSVYVVDECDGYDVYTSPILLNGEETNLRFIHDYETDEITIEGVWDGIDENGMAARNVTPLKKGDKIIPMYDAFSLETDDEYTYYGDEYVFNGDPEIFMAALPDNSYYYSFFIDDIYGDYKSTDFVTFSIENGELFYEE